MNWTKYIKKHVKHGQIAMYSCEYDHSHVFMVHNDHEYIKIIQYDPFVGEIDIYQLQLVENVKCGVKPYDTIANALELAKIAQMDA